MTARYYPWRRHPPTAGQAELLELAQGQVAKCCGHSGGWFVEALCGSSWPVAALRLPH
jgi:hypothetical protein